MRRILSWLHRAASPLPNPEPLGLNSEEPRSGAGSYPDVPPPETRLTPHMFAARYLCGDIHGEDTPRIASDLLEAGYDTPSLRRLAGEMQMRCSADAAELMTRIMREAGLSAQFDLRQARMLVTRQIARQVIAGEREPWRAALNVEQVWGWCPEDVDESVRAIINCADDVVWDAIAQRYRPVVDEDLLKSFARVARLKDEQIFS